MSQFAVLEMLYHKEDLKIGEIIVKSLSTLGNISLVIDNLVKLSLVEKKKCEEDKRITYVSITEEGKKVIKEGFPVLVFLSNIDLNRSQFKATLSSYFLTLNIVAILTYVYKGFYTPENLRVIWTYLPHVVIGTAIGMYTSTKVDEKLFSRIVNIAIPVMGLNIVWKLFG